MTDDPLDPIIDVEQLTHDVADKLGVLPSTVTGFVDVIGRTYLHGKIQPSIDIDPPVDPEEAARRLAEEYVAVGERMLKRLEADHE